MVGQATKDPEQGWIFSFYLNTKDLVSMRHWVKVYTLNVWFVSLFSAWPVSHLV